MGKRSKTKSKETKKIEEVEESTEIEASPEEPIEEIKEESKPKPVRKPQKTPERNLPLIPLQVFCSLSGKKPDQIAGFRRHATIAGLKPMTVPEWRKQLSAFQNKPMR